MRSTLVRTSVRALVAVIAAVLFIPNYFGAAPASALAPLLNGSVTTSGAVVAGQPLSLVSDFGVQSESASRLFNTEVRDANGALVGQYVETLNAVKGQRMVRTYTWNTASVIDGTYTFRQGLSKANWAGTIAWNNDSGSVDLHAKTWALTSKVTATQAGIEFSSNFVAPATASGRYITDVEVFNAAGQKVRQWYTANDLTAGKTINLTQTLGASTLPAGKYWVSQGTFTSKWAEVLNWQSKTAIFTITPSAPATTTTTSKPVPATTTTTAAARPTTTVAPTTTTVAPTTTSTTVAPTTTTTEAPTTTIPPTTTTVPPTTTTVAPTTTVPPTTVAPTTTTTAAPAPTTTVPPTTVPAPTTTVPASYNSNWTLVGGDDFNGTTLDRTRWATYDGAGTAGIGTRSSKTVSVSNGELAITGYDQVGGGMCWCGKNAGNQTYGRWEFRAKMDKGNGFGPAVLLWPQSERWPIDGEIDIFESANGSRSNADFTLHYGSNNSQGANSVKGDYSQWHTFAMEWQPDHISYWIDGKLMWTTTKAAAIPKTPMHMGIQLDAGASGWWIPGRDANSPEKIALHVDWVKIYK